jgi:hypothetical protein
LRSVSGVRACQRLDLDSAGDDVPVIEPVSSEPTLLVLHAVRLLGFADEGRVAARFALDRGEVLESLEDFEAVG